MLQSIHRQGYRAPDLLKAFVELGATADNVTDACLTASVSSAATVICQGAECISCTAGSTPLRMTISFTSLINLVASLIWKLPMLLPLLGAATDGCGARRESGNKQTGRLERS